MSINNLPKWCFTDLHPAVHDHESLTAIEMVSRLYGKMQELVTEYNKFNADILKEIEAYESGLNDDFELFKTTMAQKFQGFIDIVELKLTGVNQKVDDTIGNIKARLQDAINDMVKEMKEKGDLNAVIMDALGNYNIILQELLAKVNGAGAGRTVATGTMQRIIEVATSYLKHNNDLVYGHKHNDNEDKTLNYGNSAFVLDGSIDTLSVSYDWEKDDTGNKLLDNNGNVVYKANALWRTGKVINCSTFALLVAMGVPYEKSRYNPLNDSNKWGAAGYCYNVWQEAVTSANYEEYYNTRRLYERMEYLGCAGPILPDYSNVSAGDLVFFAPADKNELGVTIKEGGTVDQIGHVGVVLATNHTADGTPSIVIAESTSATYTIQFNNYTLADLKASYVCFVGKSSYNYIPQQESELLYKCNGAFNSHALLKDYNLTNGELVTFEFDYTPTSLEQHITIFGQPEEMSQAHLLESHRLEQLTRLNNVNELGQTYHMVITMPFSLYRQEKNGVITTKPFQPYKINRINVKVNNIAGVEDIPVLSNFKIWRGLPSTEKTTVLYPANADDLKEMLLKLVPEVTTDYQDKLSIIVHPLNKLIYDDVQLLTCDYYFDVYFRSLVSRNEKRLIAKSYAGTNEIMLIYSGTNWRHVNKSLLD